MFEGKEKWGRSRPYDRNRSMNGLSKPLPRKLLMQLLLEFKQGVKLVMPSISKFVLSVSPDSKGLFGNGSGGTGIAFCFPFALELEGEVDEDRIKR